MNTMRKSQSAKKAIPVLLSSAIVTLVILAALAWAAPTHAAQTRSNHVPAHAPDDLASKAVTNGLVDVGERKLMIHCTGRGSPTVILEAGQGADSSSWNQVQFSGDGGYRVCSYDRANLGESDAAPKPRTYLDMARDLHALLMNAHIDGPYVLVGHSGGGLLIRVFTEQYPEDVLGLVLVDAAHPDMGARLLAGLPPKSMFESKAIREWRIWLSWMSDSHGSLYKTAEVLDTGVSMQQARAAGPLGDLPLVVISRSPDNTMQEGAPPLPADINAKLGQIWQDMQSELAGLSSNSTHIIASHAGHNIPSEEPELINQAIRSMVNEVQGQMDTTNPAASRVDSPEAVHTPRILRVEKSQEKTNGKLVYRDNVIYSDAAGDAVYASIELTAGKLLENEHVSGSFITTPADEQQSEAVLDIVWVCRAQDTFVIDIQLVDQALDRSEHLELAFECPAPQMYFSPWLVIGAVAGLGLLAVAGWLLIRYRRAR